MPSRARDERVGVLAVDPTSPFTGGALLGDRVRMQEHATDPGVFIRSMATRGHLGGLAWATPQALRVLDAAGCDVILVETVGVGQSEVEVAATADTTVVLLAPGMGDAIQAAKAGILEVGDVYAVNKADRDGADATARELRMMLSHGSQPGPRASGVRRSSRRWPRAVRASRSCSRRWTTTGPGSPRVAPGTSGGCSARRRRSRRWPWRGSSPRFAAFATPPVALDWPGWPSRWRRGSSTPTRPPSSSSS